MEVTDSWSAVPSRVTSLPWILVKIPQTHRSNETSGEAENDPSVQNSQMLMNKEQKNDDGDQMVTGKWMLFLNHRNKDANGYTETDRAWFRIRAFVKNGIFSSAKCSTSNPSEGHGSQGVIMCYTDNFNDSADVKRVADAIRKAVYYPRVMYYKTDEASSSGICRKQGHRRVSLYKHTVDNLLYIRDPPSLSWKIIENHAASAESNSNKAPASNVNNSVKFSEVLDGPTDKSTLNVASVSKSGEKENESMKDENNILQSLKACRISNFENNIQRKTAIVRPFPKTPVCDRAIADNHRYSTLPTDSFSEDSGPDDHSPTKLADACSEPSIYDAAENTEDDSRGSVPSRVKSKPWIYYPEQSGDLSQFPGFGHWSIFFEHTRRNSEGLTELDRQWYKIKDLIDAAVISGAKCSTSWSKSPTHFHGIIKCYTLIEDTKKTKQAADIIRDVVDYDREIYYTVGKLNASSSSSSSLPMYKHDVDYSFYGRSNDGWEQLEME